ncbi:MerR family transcriptional regulator [Tengunoibacter tsumagoiensis]|uniref:MerR family transcriptional regulator n=1 Tax=Tengunoibacter tsumagoiensis TaxID=2014871 RepID=A0A402A6A7_9CHLR|nr:MerR family transcriptional regulator [Tengunoibacter tsumagoiensis]GCE14662.1 MerR family transcriptional regulator [Tengunoibacter tsumagoiensis]
MFKIGDFSKLSQVSIKTLRYYDDFGLLKPAAVDEESGYRYYEGSQLGRLNRILALKDMGLSLTQIAQVLKENITPDHLRGMLHLKQMELEQHLQDEQFRLHRIEAWLQQYGGESTMPQYDVVIKSLPEIRVLQRQAVAPTQPELGPTLDRSFDSVMDALSAQGAKPLEAPTTVYYNEEYCDINIHVGACTPFEGKLNPELLPQECEIITLPAVKVASTIHHGSFATMHQAYQAILQWIESNGYQICAPNRELNLVYQRNGDQANFVTEIQFPVQIG